MVDRGQPIGTWYAGGISPYLSERFHFPQPYFFAVHASHLFFSCVDFPRPWVLSGTPVSFFRPPLSGSFILLVYKRVFLTESLAPRFPFTYQFPFWTFRLYTFPFFFESISTKFPLNHLGKTSFFPC